MTPQPINPPRPTSTPTHRLERCGLLYVYIPIKPAKP